MAAEITRKLKQFTAADPLGRPSSEDPWRDFREIEVLDFALEFRFSHSLGKLSRFFLELEKQHLVATRCPHCGTVWMPPRPTCGNDLAITEWIELDGTGTLVAATRSAYTLTTSGGEDHLVLGYVALDGASTLLFQQIRNYGDGECLVAGLPVRVAWASAAVEHPMESFWFEPVD